MIDHLVDAGMDGMISDLQALIRQPSVSAKKVGLTECANLVAGMMQKAGIESEVLYLDDKGVPPIVYGEVRSKSNPGRTILFYNHYDVQPEEPLELWEDAPFSGTVKGNQIFGRGSADDKGELITRIKAVEYYIKETGDVPCNVKFIVEGEEEIGSAHVEEYLEKYREKLACDGVIWEFGYVDAKDRPIISLGMKGLLYVELIAQGPSRDAHSSLAVLIENPAWRLVSALKTMRDPSGRVTIKDWYREVRPFTKQELAVIAKEPFDEQEFKEEYGIRRFVAGARGRDAKKALVGMPTCNIAGFDSGYIGEGAKTVLAVKGAGQDRLSPRARHGAAKAAGKAEKAPEGPRLCRRFRQFHPRRGGRAHADKRPVREAGGRSGYGGVRLVGAQRLLCRHGPDVLVRQGAGDAVHIGW